MNLRYRSDFNAFDNEEKSERRVAKVPKGSPRGHPEMPSLSKRMAVMKIFQVAPEGTGANTTQAARAWVSCRDRMLALGYSQCEGDWRCIP